MGIEDIFRVVTGQAPVADLWTPQADVGDAVDGPINDASPVLPLRVGFHGSLSPAVRGIFFNTEIAARASFLSTPADRFRFVQYAVTTLQSHDVESRRIAEADLRAFIRETAADGDVWSSRALVSLHGMLAGLSETPSRESRAIFTTIDAALREIHLPLNRWGLAFARVTRAENISPLQGDALNLAVEMMPYMDRQSLEEMGVFFNQLSYISLLLEGNFESEAGIRGAHAVFRALYYFHQHAQANLISNDIGAEAMDRFFAHMSDSPALVRHLMRQAEAGEARALAFLSLIHARAKWNIDRALERSDFFEQSSRFSVFYEGMLASLSRAARDRVALAMRDATLLGDFVESPAIAVPQVARSVQLGSISAFYGVETYRRIMNYFAPTYAEMAVIKLFDLAVNTGDIRSLVPLYRMTFVHSLLFDVAGTSPTERQIKSRALLDFFTCRLPETQFHLLTHNAAIFSDETRERIVFRRDVERVFAELFPLQEMPQTGEELLNWLGDYQRLHQMRERVIEDVSNVWFRLNAHDSAINREAVIRQNVLRSMMDLSQSSREGASLARLFLYRLSPDVVDGQVRILNTQIRAELEYNVRRGLIAERDRFQEIQDHVRVSQVLMINYVGRNEATSSEIVVAPSLESYSRADVALVEQAVGLIDYLAERGAHATGITAAVAQLEPTGQFYGGMRLLTGYEYPPQQNPDRGSSGAPPVPSTGGGGGGGAGSGWSSRPVEREALRRDERPRLVLETLERALERAIERPFGRGALRGR